MNDYYTAATAAIIGLFLGGAIAWFVIPRGRSKQGIDRTAAEQVELMRNLLAFLLVGAFVGSVPMFVFKDIPSGNQDIIVYMMGQLSGMALTALGFYFVNKAGQDAVDAKRTDNTKVALEAIRDTAKVAQTAQTDKGKADAPSGEAAADAAEETSEAAVDKAEEIRDRKDE